MLYIQRTNSYYQQRGKQVSWWNCDCLYRCHGQGVRPVTIAVERLPLTNRIGIQSCHPSGWCWFTQGAGLSPNRCSPKPCPYWGYVTHYGSFYGGISPLLFCPATLHAQIRVRIFCRDPTIFFLELCMGFPLISIPDLTPHQFVLFFFSFLHVCGPP